MTARSTVPDAIGSGPMTSPRRSLTASSIAWRPMGRQSWPIKVSSFCNGPAFSPDNRKLYFSDTVGHRILSYDLDRDGAISGRRTFFTFSADDGMPDGLTVDSAGNVWCALYGGGKVVCIDAKGALKLSLPLPGLMSQASASAGRSSRRCMSRRDGARTTEATKAKDVGGAVFMRPVDSPGLPEPVITL